MTLRLSGAACALLSLGLSSCSSPAPINDPPPPDGDDPDPACSVACDSDARCVTSAGAARCACNDGFVGDGTACAAPVELRDFAIRPQELRASQLADVVFAQRHATACELSIGSLATRWTIDPASGGTATPFQVALSPEDATALVEAGEQLATAVLTCAGDTAPGLEVNVASSRFYVFVDPLPAVNVTVSGAPSEGGQVSLCWDAPWAASCRVAGGEPWTELNDLPAQGCVDVEAAASGSYDVVCSGAGVEASKAARLVVGSGIQSFVVEPQLLPSEGGLATVSWSAQEVQSCELSAAGSVLSTDLTGFLTQRVSASTTFRLACVNGEQSYVEERPVWVGPSITKVGASRTPEATLEAGWSAMLVDECALTATFGAYAAHRTGLGREESIVLALPPWTNTLPVDVSFTCTGPEGETTRAVVAPPPPGFTTFTLDPPGLPSEGGTATLCYASTGTDGCTLSYGDQWMELLGPEACVELVVDYGDAGFLDCWGATGMLSRTFTVPTGPSILDLTVAPVELGEPGTVTATWSTLETDACVLFAAGELAAEGPSGNDVAIAIGDDTDVALRCTAGGQWLSEVRRVQVGFGIDSFEFQPTPAGVNVGWTSTGMDVCAVSMVSGETVMSLDGMAPDLALVPTGKGTKPFPKPKPGAAYSSAFFSFDRLAAGATLTLTCTGPHGDATRTAEVPVALPASIDSFALVPAHLPAEGGAIDVCWTASNVSGCMLDVVNSAFFPTLPASGCLGTDAWLPQVGGSTVVNLYCSGDVGPVDASLPLLVGPGIGALTASPDYLAGPGETTVSWQAFEVAACDLYRGAAVIATGSEGSVAVSVTATTELVLRCQTNDGGEVEESLVVAVGPSIIDLTLAWPNDQEIQATWQAAGVERCTVIARAESSGGEVGRAEELPAAGSISIYYPSREYGPVVVDLTCTGSGVDLTRSARLDPPAAAALDAMWATPPSLTGPGSFDVCWTVREVTWCGLSVGELGGEIDLTGWPLDASGAATVCASDVFGITPSAELTAVAWVGCSGIGGWVDRSLVIPVGPWITSFTVSAKELSEPGSVNVAWEAYNVDGCTLVAAGGEPQAVGAIGQMDVAITATTDVLLTCEGGGEALSAAATVVVGAGIQSFTAYALSPVDLLVEWRATFVDGCSLERRRAVDDSLLEPVWVANEGGYQFAHDFALEGAARLVLACTAGSDVFTAEAVVDMPGAPVIESFAASPATLEGPGDVDLCWSTSGASWCEILVSEREPFASPYGNWGMPPAGCLTDFFGAPFAIPATARASLTCWGAGGSAHTDLVVPVGPAITSFVVDPVGVDGGGVVRVTWDTYRMTACTLAADGQGTLAETTSGGLAVTVATATTLTLSCTSDTGDAFTDSRLVPVGPAVVWFGGEARSGTELWVAWSVFGVDFCTLHLSDALGRTYQELPGLPADGHFALWFELNLYGDAIAELSCDSAAGPVQSTTIVIPSPLPSLTLFSADPSALAGPGTVQICWSATRVDACRLTAGGETNDVGAAGCNDMVLDANDASADVSITCDNGFGSASEALSIPVGPTIVELIASPQNLPPEGFYTALAWRASFVDDCTLWRGQDPLGSGAASAGLGLFVDETTTFELRCQAGPEELSRELTVTTGLAITDFVARSTAPNEIYVTFTSLWADNCGLSTSRASNGALIAAHPLKRSQGTVDVWTYHDFATHGDALVTVTCVAGSDEVTASAVVSENLETDK